MGSAKYPGRARAQAPWAARISKTEAPTISGLIPRLTVHWEISDADLHRRSSDSTLASALRCLRGPRSNGARIDSVAGRLRTVTPPLLPEPPAAADPAQLFATADIILDSSVVLNLYRMSRATREAWFGVLEQVQPRLVMPHQVALEVSRNAATVRNHLPTTYVELRKQLDAIRALPAARFGGSKHLHGERVQTLKSIIEKHLDAMLAEFDRAREQDHAVVDAERDTVMNRLDRLYAGQVLPEPDAVTIRRRVARFHEYRAPNQVPPGWKDAGGKSTPQLEAGDYLLWAEVMGHARSTKRRVIIVTDDAKDDWWLKQNGMRPVPAMVAEFVRATGHPHSQITAQAFLELAQQQLTGSENEEAVTETAEVAATYADLAHSGLTYTDLARSGLTYDDLAARDPRWAHLVSHGAERSGSWLEELLAAELMRKQARPHGTPAWRRALEDSLAREQRFTVEEAAVVYALVADRTLDELRGLPRWMRVRIAGLMPWLAEVIEPELTDGAAAPGEAESGNPR